MKFSNTLFKGSILVALLVMLTAAVSAQRTVKGKVTDAENGEGLVGATVTVVGTTRGATTDVDGNYSVEVPSGSTQLRFSYTGYTEQVVALAASNVVNVAMAPGSVLDEVVVVGYSAAKKSDLTGAVTSVGEKDFNQGLVTAPDQLIQGKAAGVQIVNNSGQPGGATTVRIRGTSSIRAGNNPLFVVDGIQLSGGSTKPGVNSGDLGSTAGSNPLNYLNPSDIESIQVLKDASATAIYGSRGANGVIIITTKRGKAGTPTVQFNTSVGGSSILKEYDVLSGDEYRSALNSYGLTNGDYGSSVDAMGEILQTGIVQNHSIAVSGGSDGGTYRIGLSYLDQEGIIKTNGLRRINANINGSYKFLESKRLGLNFNLITSQSRDNGPAISTNAGFQGSLIGNALQWNPTHPLYEADGSPVIVPQFGNTSINPVALLDAYRDQTNTVDVLARIEPYYQISDNLTYRMAFNVTHGNGDRRSQLARWINFQNIQGRGLASYSANKQTYQVLTHTLEYKKSLESGINMTALAGYEYQNRRSSGLGFSALGFELDDFDYTNIFQASQPNTRTVGSGAAPVTELQSYFAQANFNFSERFLLTATVRADGSSKFGANNKYGYFPSAAAAWNLHNESFIKGSAFDQLKLRVGYGLTGNSEFDAGAAQESYFISNNNNKTVVGLSNVANPDLKWETTTTANIGVDFALWNYKLSGSLEYFNRNTSDLLFQFPTIQPAPAALYWINLPGNLINSGVELALNSLVVDRENFNVSVGANVTFLQNKLTNYNGPRIPYGEVFGQGSSGAVSQLIADGQPLNSFYTRQFLGINPETGQSEYVGGSAETPDFVGNPNPNVLAGFYGTMNAGKFSLNLAFNGAYGHVIYNNTKMTVIPIGNLGTRNIDANLIGTGVQEATSNAIKPSSRYLEKGDYTKLANATLSYNFGNIGNSIRNARVYVTGQNLLVFTDYSGFDPEVNTINTRNNLPSFGIEYIPYPSARTIIVGANFSF